MGGELSGRQRTLPGNEEGSISFRVVFSSKPGLPNYFPTSPQHHPPQFKDVMLCAYYFITSSLPSATQHILIQILPPISPRSEFSVMLPQLVQSASLKFLQMKLFPKPLSHLYSMPVIAFSPVNPRASLSFQPYQHLCIIWHHSPDLSAHVYHDSILSWLPLTFLNALSLVPCCLPFLYTTFVHSFIRQIH